MRGPVGRYCELSGIDEVTKLEAGMDFRRPEYRREVFKRFYRFQLEYHAHPGCVYFLLPAMWEGLDVEDRYWIAFLNANTQNPITTKLFLEVCPHLPDSQSDMQRLDTFFNDNWSRLPFDTDRRYQKKDFMKSVKAYKLAVDATHGTQEEFFATHGGSGSAQERFELIWRAIRKYLYTFGRLATWSYMDYLMIVGEEIEPGGLMLNDMKGSMSHRNGLAKVLGRDDLDWHKSHEFSGDYTDDEMEWLEGESWVLWRELHESINHPHCSLLTLESAFCTFKGWFRPNRRYPNVYVDMLHDRIKQVEEKWGRRLDWFWEQREANLPKQLLQEHNNWEGGLTRRKQNWFRETGEVIHMDLDWDCFSNNFNPEAV